MTDEGTSVVEKLTVESTTQLGDATGDTVTVYGNVTTSGNPNFDYSGSSGTFLSPTGAGTLSGLTTASLGIQATSIARTTSADGTGTGLIADVTTMVTVTSGGANEIITLPTPTPGNIVWLLTHGDSTGFELRTDTPASVGINGGTGASAESAIAAAITMVRCVCVSATEWICSQFDADGDESKVEAAA